MAIIADPEKWRELVAAERLRQLGLGYTPEHDDEHGVVHLLQLIIEYLRRAQTVEAAAMADAALDVIRRAGEQLGGAPDLVPTIATALHRRALTADMLGERPTAEEYALAVVNALGFAASAPEQGPIEKCRECGREEFGHSWLDHMK